MRYIESKDTNQVPGLKPENLKKLEKNGWGLLHDTPPENMKEFGFEETWKIIKSSGLGTEIEPFSDIDGVNSFCEDFLE